MSVEEFFIQLALDFGIGAGLNKGIKKIGKKLDEKYHVLTPEEKLRQDHLEARKACRGYIGGNSETKGYELT